MNRILSLKGIEKYFQAVHALKKIDLDIYEGETLPEDFICPICKHPASDFEEMKEN